MSTIPSSGSDHPVDGFSNDPGLQYIVTHVFVPAQPGTFWHNVAEVKLTNDRSLVHAACAATHTYGEIIDDTLKPQWHRIEKMLYNLEAFNDDLPKPGDLIFQLRGMHTGGAPAISLQSSC